MQQYRVKPCTRDQCKELKQRATLQERTNTPLIHVETTSLVPYASGSTSKGVMATSTSPRPSSSSSASPSKDLRAQREHRYSRAEEALARSLRRCASGTSDRDMQIRALERATTLLAARAREAHERAGHLRERLARADVGSANYLELKKQRWLEERHEGVAVQEEKAARERLAAMMRSIQPPSVEPRFEWSHSQAPKRKEANLARFLQNSSTKRLFHAQPVRSNCSANLAYRRKTLSDVSTLRLRPGQKLSMEVEKLLQHKGHQRTRSLPVNQPEHMKTVDTHVMDVRRTKLSLKSALAAVTEAEDPEIKRGRVRLASATDPATGTVLPDVPANPRPRSRRHPTTRVSMGHGDILILPRARPRLPADIIANLGDIALPDYAVDLMRGFTKEAVTSLHLDRATATESSSSSSSNPSCSGTTITASTSTKPSMPPAREPWTKRLSIFSIHLPQKPSGTELAPLEEVPEEAPVSAPSTPVRRRPRALRSTRDWDLAQLGGAPDDVQENSLPLRSIRVSVSESKSSRVGTPGRVVDKVKQRFSFLGRKLG